MVCTILTIRGVTMARPTKLTDEVFENIVEDVEKGSFPETAARKNGMGGS